MEFTPEQIAVSCIPKECSSANPTIRITKIGVVQHPPETGMPPGKSLTVVLSNGKYYAVPANEGCITHDFAALLRNMANLLDNE